ncbi:MAG: RCC1-like domain-containing protein [Nocardioidaceae bacterium]
MVAHRVPGTHTGWRLLLAVTTPAASCGLHQDNTVWCWGDNTHGQAATARRPIDAAQSRSRCRPKRGLSQASRDCRPSPGNVTARSFHGAGCDVQRRPIGAAADWRGRHLRFGAPRGADCSLVMRRPRDCRGYREVVGSNGEAVGSNEPAHPSQQTR